MTDSIPAGFQPLLEVRSLLASLTVPWWIGGGWAIDLAVGRPTRPHGDIDVVLLERDEHALRTDLADVDLLLMTGPDHREQPWPPGRRLTAGPDRVRLLSPRLPLPCEVLLEAAVGSRWVYHRGQPAITLPFSEAGRQRFGIPFLAPEVVLATKAVFTRDKDQHDFEAALPVLSAVQRQWLRGAITRLWQSARRRADDPDAEASEHPWTAPLTETAGPPDAIQLLGPRSSTDMDGRYVRGRAFNLSLLATAYATQDEPVQAAAARKPGAVSLQGEAVRVGDELAARHETSRMSARPGSRPHRRR